MTLLQHKLGFRRGYLTGLIIFATLVGSAILLGVLTYRWAQPHVRAFGRELEQMAVALERTPHNPDQAIPQTRHHLKLARVELEILRPIAEPVVVIAEGLSVMPIIGQHAEQFAGLWTFSEETTILAESILEGLEAGNIYFQAINADDVEDDLELSQLTIQSHLQTIEFNLAQTQQARVKIGSLDKLDSIIWLSTDQATRLQKALARWDTFAPPATVILAELNPLLNGIDLKQVWTDTRSLIFELKQLAASLENVENVEGISLETVTQIQQHLATIQTTIETLRPTAEHIIVRADNLAFALEKISLPEEGAIAEYPKLLKQTGPWWHFTESLLLFGREISNMAELGLLNVNQGGIDGAIAAIPVINEQVEATETHFLQAQAARADLMPITGLPDNLIAPFNTALAQWDAVEQILAEHLSPVNDLTRVLPSLLGTHKPVTYLLLLHTSF